MNRFVILLWLHPLLASPATNSLQLLPTAGLKREIAALQSPLKTDSEMPLRKRQAPRVEKHISEFLIRQLEIAPSISRCQLEIQLRKIFGAQNPVQCQGNDKDLDVVPHAFATDVGPKATRRQVVITYGLSLGYYSGIATVLESYLWENGTARLTTRSDKTLLGYLTRTELLAWYPDQYWLLISGMMYGASGSTLPGRAGLYQVGIDSVKVLWQTPILRNLVVLPSDNRWEASYVDERRWQEGAPDPYILDIYRFDYPRGTFRRIIHQHYQ